MFPCLLTSKRKYERQLYGDLPLGILWGNESSSKGLHPGETCIPFVLAGNRVVFATASNLAWEKRKHRYLLGF